MNYERFCYDVRHYKVLLKDQEKEVVDRVVRETSTNDKHPENINNLLEKVQSKVGRDRINLREKFYDFDKLRK